MQRASSILSRALVGGALTGVAILALASAGRAELPERIKLAGFASITGGNASTNVTNLDGIKFAVAEIVKAGGIAGKPLDLVLSDDQSDPTAAVAEARRLAGQEKVAVVIGPMTSQYALAVAPIFAEGKIASIVTAGSTAYTAKVSPLGFSIIPPADVQAQVMVDYAVDTLNAKSIAFIGDNGAQAKAAVEAVKAHAAKRGVKLAGLQEFQFRATDVTPELLSLRRVEPDALLMWPNTGEDHGLIIKALADLHWTVKVVNGGGSALSVTGAKQVFEDAFRNVPSTMLKSWSYCPADPMGSGELTRFKDKLKAFLGEDEYKKIAPNYAAWTYDAVYVMKAAIEGSKSTDGPTLAQWIEQNAKSVHAVSGPLAAGPDNHFLMSDPKGIGMVIDTDKPREDGLYRRLSGC